MCVVSSEILMEQVNKDFRFGGTGEVLMAVVMKFTVFWDVTSCSLVENDQRNALPWLMRIVAANQINPCGIYVSGTQNVLLRVSQVFRVGIIPPILHTH
jgi:hypothetical protein